MCEPPKGQASPQAGREMLENIASLPLLLWNAQFLSLPVFSTINQFPFILQRQILFLKYHYKL